MSCASKQRGFHEVTIVDLTVKHDTGLLAKGLSTNTSIVINAAIKPEGPLNAASPDFLIILQDRFRPENLKVRMSEVLSLFQNKVILSEGE